MNEMKCICDILRGNNEEAREYMEKANTTKATDKQLADWMRSMAVAHINFNDTGVAIAKKHIEDLKNRSERPEYFAGMAAVWEQTCDGLAFEMAEVKAMVEGYK